MRMRCMRYARIRCVFYGKYSDFQENLKILAKWPVLNRKVVNLQEGKFEVSDQENLNFGSKMLQLVLKSFKLLEKSF